MLLERDDEQAALDRLLADSAGGRGRVAVVTGVTGSGKTALLYHFAERAAEAGVTWLSAIGSRAEQDLPLGVFSQLFLNASIPAERAALAAQLLDSAGVQAANWYDTPPGAVERLRITQGLCNAVVNLSDTQPVLVTIDDVHYADKASLWQLQFFIRRLTSARILLVLTEADRVITTDPALDLNLLHHPRCLQIELAPLSPDGVTDLVRRNLDVPDAEALGARYHQVSGGNPLLVNAILDDHRELLRGPGEQRPDAPIPTAGPRLTRSVHTLLDHAGPEVLEVARGLAVLGDSFFHTPADLFDAEPGTVGQALDHLTAVGLLEAERFRHPIARAAVLSGMDPERRDEMNHRAARLLHTEGAAPTVMARHLIAGTPPKDPWVLPVLREAAEQALLNDDAELAVRCLKPAAALCADAAQRARITAMLARAEWRINPALAERHIPDLVAAVDAGTLRQSETHDLIRLMLWHGRLEPAQDLMATYTARAAEGDAEAAARLSITRHLAWSSYPSSQDAAALDRGAAGDTSLTSTTTHLRLQAARLLTSVLRDGPGKNTTRTAEGVLQSVTLSDDTAEAVHSMLYALIYSDRVDRAAHWSQVCHEDALERDVPTWRAMIDSIRAEVALRQGELPTAVRHARAALEVLRPRSWGVVAGLPLSTLLHATTEMGRYGEAAALLRQPVPDAMFKTRFGLHYLHARGHYHLALDQVQTALGDFLTCGELMREWGIDTPALVSWRTGAASACLRMGDQERATALMEEQRTLPGARTPRTRGISLRLFAATVELRQRPALLREAVDLLQSAGDGLQRAYTLAALAGNLQALGEMSKARMIGNLAHSTASACHAEPLTRKMLAHGSADDKADAIADTVGADEGLSVLSEAEQRVASLAALGYSNREIARKIHITTSTVEQHLTRAYRKLKVNGRRDLPARMSPEMSTTPA
ncbi:helix-turn-helix transcriptional regulator [Spirillospora sp. CA-294931]|uniref:helix-turn-helix transcriptional regulator n=1 Tax=Spirillospora sp. CA-294931 TaxID=3240042 RepID=UPI003D90E6D3